MIKKIKRLLLLILILPISIMVVSCGTPKKPSGGNDGGSDPIDPNPDLPDPPPVVVEETYSVQIDYNLPEKYSFLLVNPEKVTLKTSEKYNLPTISDNLSIYFEYWYFSNDNTKIEDNEISGEKDTNYQISAKWKENEFKKEFSYGELEFSYNDANNTAKIIKANKNYNKIIIPEIVKKDNKNYTVNEFDASVFENSNVNEIITYSDSNFIVNNKAFHNSKLEKIDFSKIKYIGNFAFANTNLKNVKFSSLLESINDYSFSNSKFLESVDYSKVINNFEIFPKSIFEGCESLTTVIANNNFSVISENAFKNCANLKNLDLLSYTNLIKIDSYAFDGCSSITDIILPENIINFGYNIFNNCNNVISVKLPRLIRVDQFSMFKQYFGNNTESLNKIELYGNEINILYNDYFDGFINVETFIMNDSIINIQRNAFYGLNNLKNIYFSKSLDPNKFDISTLKNTLWFKENKDVLEINNALVYVPNSISGIYEIPQNIISISKKAFFGNQNITSIIFNENLGIISDSAFENCANLVSVNFEKSNKLKIIGEKAFFNTKIMGNLKLPKTIEYIGDAAFSCTKIDSILVDIENKNYATINNALYKIDADRNPIILLKYFSTDNKSMFKVPNTVEIIGDYAFENTYITAIIVDSLSKNLQLNKNCLGITINMLNVLNKNDSKIKYTQFSGNIKVYKFIASDKYTYNVNLENISFEFDSSIQTGDYFVEIEVENIKKVYILNLINNSNNVIIDRIIEIK